MTISKMKSAGAQEPFRTKMWKWSKERCNRSNEEEGEDGGVVGHAGVVVGYSGGEIRGQYMDIRF